MKCQGCGKESEEKYMCEHCGWEFHSKAVLDLLQRVRHLEARGQAIAGQKKSPSKGTKR